MELTELDAIETGRAALPGFVRLTPILPIARSAREIGNERLFVKCENLQVTGAYKIRAVCNLLRLLTDEQRAQGIVMTSSGNFAQAFAYAGREMGVPICVVMMDTTSAFKVESTREHGADVVFCGTDAMARQPTVERVAAERGMYAIDTWEDPRIVPGHGSIGLEVIEQLPDVEQVLVPVSSGGLGAGVATAIKLKRPEVKVIGVQPIEANAAELSLRQGEPVTIEHWNSIADGLSARRPGEFPLAHLMAYLDDIVLVEESDIGRAFVTLLERGKLLAEPAGAVASAGFLSGQIDQSKRTCALLSGGNLTAETRASLFELAEQS
jgi:threonine dehydratase